MKKFFAIGASGASCEFVIPKILPELIKKLGNVELKVDVRDSLRIYEKVLRGDLEIGIIGIKTESEYIDFKPILKGDRLVVIAPPGHSLTSKKEVTLEDLKGQDFVGFTPGTGTRTAYEHVFQEAGLSLENDLNVVVEIGDSRGVIQAVEVGTGIAVISELAAKNRIQLGTVMVLNIPALHIVRDFYLVTLKNKPLSDEAKIAVSVIAGVLKT